MAETPGAEKFLLCFQCGTCTAGCPISRFSSLYNPRKIARMVQLGLKDKLLSDVALWLCTTCYTCIDNCPQGVEVASIVRILRNFSVKERRIMPLISKKLALNILKTGYAYVIPESRIRRRIARGLPHLPKSNLKQIAKLFEVTDFLDTIENAETFEKVEVKE
ncbi:4Fe-4S dicluster domain-containing protein [Candidatus Bathyarchaeota archaeon]|nr:4Fe-4S dicluster domain-containing protein [Candidatus Bathyarchaeota archaeon]